MSVSLRLRILTAIAVRYTSRPRRVFYRSSERGVVGVHLRIGLQFRTQWVLITALTCTFRSHILSPSALVVMELLNFLLRTNQNGLRSVGFTLLLLHTLAIFFF